MQTLSISEARHIALHSQGLLRHGFGKGKKGILNTLKHLGYIQIDTLAVVERAHHHTLWTRLPDYSSVHLDELLAKEKNIFEYWSHAASYLPISEYRFSLPRKRLYMEGRSHWFKKDKKVMSYVLDRIRNEGPLCSRDFETKNKRAGAWYEWKPTKQALEQLFMQGTLMVSKRQGFQKVYDLTERVLPPGTDTSFPSESEFSAYLVRKAVNAHGLVSEKEITYLRKGWSVHVKAELQRMLKEGELVTLKVENGKEFYYTSQEKLELLNKPPADPIHILSPFDNSLIQRKRIEQLFNFSYQVECYVPEPKRIYGYFCLPILFGSSFAGRLDPKADRSSKTFYVYKLYLEPGFCDNDFFLRAFADKLKEFALFNGCEKIVIEKAEPKKVVKELKKLVQF